MLRRLLAIAACLAAAPLFAQDVTLSARDGSIELSGSLLSYDGEFYRIDTIYGALTVDGSGVLCDGPGCPNLTAFVAELTLASAAPLTASLASGLIRAFAAAEGYDLRTIVGDAEEQVHELIEPATGLVAGRFALMATDTAAGAEAAVTSEQADFALSRSEKDGGQIVALDALVPIVATDNPLRALSLEQVGQALSGGISDWSALGGDDMPVVLKLPEPGQAGRDLLVAAFPGAMTAAEILDDLAEEVTRDPFALGFAPLSEVGRARPVALAGPCGIPGHATADTVKTEEYPLVLPVYLHARAGRLPRLGREFAAFARSPASQAAVRDAGFVDQSLEIVPFTAQGSRLADAVTTGADAAGLAEVQRMVADLRDFGRLTVAFRFRDGSSDLDSHSRSNVALVADAFDRGAFDTADLIVAGFSDGQGDAASNLRLSRQRARAVREAILSAMTPPVRDAAMAMDVRGYGEAAPIACDEVDWGRHLNRRVEIWVRQR
jgi:phosphate transport system substrate-binding protein